LQQRLDEGTKMSKWSKLMLVVAMAGCGSKETRADDAPQPVAVRHLGGDAGTSRACGLALFDDDACESWLDATCCAEQKECSNDPACVDVVACIAGCGDRHNDTCINECEATSTAFDRVEALTECMKYHPTDAGPAGAICAWPR
jgi:hypothetical protein